jgi:hypothetical protein
MRLCYQTFHDLPGFEVVYSKGTMFAYTVLATVLGDAALALFLKLGQTENPDCYSTPRHIALKKAWAYAAYEAALSGGLIAPPPSPRETAHCGACKERWEHTGPFGITWGSYSG